MPPDTRANFESAYAALGSLEKSGRRLARLPWICNPPLVLWSAFAGTSHALDGSWWWLLDFAIIAWCTWQANNLLGERAAVDEFVARHRRKLAWLEKLHAGEEQRLAAKGEIKMPDGYARFQILCTRHCEPFALVNANRHAAARVIMQEFFNRFMGVEKPANPSEFEKRVAAFAEGGQAMCCYLGDEVMAKVLAVTPPSTLDEEKDSAEAMRLVPTVESYDKRH